MKISDKVIGREIQDEILSKIFGKPASKYPVAIEDRKWRWFFKHHIVETIDAGNGWCAVNSIEESKGKAGVPVVLKTGGVV